MLAESLEVPKPDSDWATRRREYAHRQQGRTKKERASYEAENTQCGPCHPTARHALVLMFCHRSRPPRKQQSGEHFVVGGLGGFTRDVPESPAARTRRSGALSTSRRWQRWP